MAGPSSRAALTIDELSAMALGRSSRSSTIWTTIDCRAGMSKALMRPWKTLSARTCQTWMTPAERERREQRRLDHRQDLRDEQDAVAIPAVDEHAGERREEERGDLARRSRRRRGASAEPVSR